MIPPRVSVIVPAFRARGSLRRALRSIARCGLPAELVEIIVASDDGSDYRAVPGLGQRLVFVPHGPRRTGPGPARNRALAVARGEVIAFLDADDEWAPGYLTALLPLARRHGAAFGRTVVTDGGRDILRLPVAGERLRLTDLERTGGSFVPLVTRGLVRPFSRHLSQDVRQVAGLLARMGGSAPVAQVDYRLRLNPGSITAAAGFSDRVALAYARHIAEIERGDGDIPAPMRAAVAEVFRQKARLNDAYRREAAPGESFYAFMARQLTEGD